MTARSRIGEILVKAQVIDDLQLRSALARLDQWGGRLARIVAELGFAEEEAVVEALAKALATPRVRLGALHKDPAALAKVDAAFAEAKAIFPVQLADQGKRLVLAMADPSDLETVDEVGRRARVRVTVQIAGELEIQAAISRHYHHQDAAQAAAPKSRTGSFRAEPSPSPEPEAIAGDGGRYRIIDMEAEDAAEQAEAEAEASAPAGAGADFLESIFSDAAAGLSAEDLKRLQGVRDNQEKSTRIVRAVMELLLEKGYLDMAALKARMG
jgi:hypothetical protein